MHKELSEDIIKALSIARFAPSSHNTQPWLVKLYGNYVDLGYNPSRQLLVGDPSKKELFISLGCFVESLRIAAEELDLLASTTFIGADANLVARIKFERRSGIKTVNLNSNLIKDRRSDRRLYEKKKVSNDILNELKDIGGNKVSLKIFNDRNDIDFFADITFKATLEAMSEQVFRSELASWVRHNWTKQQDGMPAYTQGMPGLISLIAKPVINKNKKVAVSQAKKDAKRIRNSDLIILICCKDDSPSALLNVGAAYQDACLISLYNDIKTAGISAGVISPDTSKEIIERFNLDLIPAAIIRAGYKPGSVRASPRLDLLSIIA